MRATSIAPWILLVSTVALAQPLPDSIIVQKGVLTAKTQYELAMEGTHHLYNGSEYIAYQPRDEEHPYFLSPDWAFGEIRYDGDTFSNVPMLYDLQKDLLVVSYYYKGVKMQLVKARLDEFNIWGHRFVNIKSNDSLVLRNGFYELVYNGQIKLLARKVKKLNESFSGTELFANFAESTQYYFKINEQFFRVSNKKSVLKAATDRKKELRTFIRKNNLFSNKKDNYFLQVAQFLDGLNL